MNKMTLRLVTCRTTPPALLAALMIQSVFVIPSLPAQDVDFRIESRIRALQLVSARPLGRRFELTVVNTGAKTVTGFVLKLPTGEVTAQEFLLPIHPGIQSGQTFSRIYGHAYPGRQPPASITVTLSAVIFIDNSAEGDPSGVAHLRESRVGRAAQLRRIVAILDETFGSEVEPAPTALREAADRIGKLPDDLGDGRQPAAWVQSGLRAARQETVHELQNILDLHVRAPQVSLRPAVERLRLLSRNVLEVLATAATQER